MANLDFCDKHNMVAYLQKSEGSEGFHQIIDFLTTSHIRYALTESPTIYVSLIEQFWQTASASTLENGDMEITATIDGKVKVVSEASIRRHLKLEDSDGPFHSKKADSQNRRREAATMMPERLGRECVVTLHETHSNVDKLHSFLPSVVANGSKLSYEAHVSTPSYDPPQSGEDSLQLSKLINLCTSLQEKSSSRKEEGKSRTSGLRRLRKVGSSSRVESSINASLGTQEDASKQGRKIEDLDADADVEVTLVNENQEMNDDNLMFDTCVLEEQEIEFEKVVAEPVVSVATTTKSILVSTAEVVTTASAIVQIPDELTLSQTLIEIKTAKPKPITTTATIVTSVRPRDKGIIFHDQEEQIKLQAKLIEAQLQAKLIEEEMLARKKEEEANIALIKSWDNIQAMIRKKHFAKLRAEEIRRKSPTKAQKRKVVKGSESRTKESSKRAGDELESEMLKKQKIDEHVEVEKDDQEEAEMKRYIEIVKDDEVAIDVIPLATKPPVIVEYQIDKDRRMGYFKLIRADGSLKRPGEDYERVLWGDLKVMFEHDIKSEVWRNLQGYKVTVWKLFDNCGVHFVRESFKDFDNGLYNEINEVKTVFNQMEATVEQCYVDKKCFEIQKKELLLENNRLLELIISQDLVHTAVNSLEVLDECESLRESYIEEYSRNLTRVVPSTSASRSQSNNNTRKDMIMPATSSNKKNKTIEVHPRKVMSSSTKMNRVSLCNAIFKHAVKDVNSKFSNKSKKMEWKPTGKVFTSVRHRWLPTGRTFTIIGTQCPQTKITANPIVPPKETSPTPVLTPSPEVKLANQGLVRGLPRLKFEKNHLCFACSLGKSKKYSHKPKAEDTNQEKLYLLHIDLCGPMRVERINRKKYILVIVDDYSRFTWVMFFRSKDEAPEVIIKYLKKIQVRLKATI
ncbi:ribonuclease H-like domain-containing protein [Tanacetum coccineum]